MNRDFNISDLLDCTMAELLYVKYLLSSHKADHSQERSPAQDGPGGGFGRTYPTAAKDEAKEI